MIDENPALELSQSVEKVDGRVGEVGQWFVP